MVLARMQCNEIQMQYQERRAVYYVWAVHVVSMSHWRLGPIPYGLQPVAHQLLYTHTYYTLCSPGPLLYSYRHICILSVQYVRSDVKDEFRARLQVAVIPLSPPDDL